MDRTARLVVDATKRESRMMAMLGAFIPSGAERYSKMIDFFARTEEIGAAKREMELLTFDPKTLSVISERYRRHK